MKYIRTKDGRIFNKSKIICYAFREDYISPNWNDDIEKYLQTKIIAEADTIEDLIMPGDLVRYDVLYMSWIEKDRGDKVRGIDMHLIPRKSVNMLWIPTGNDTECYPNFKLVASKEDEKGDLELL